MPYYSVFERPLLVRHRTSLCSKATLFYVLISLLTVIVPLLIVYRTQGLWVKRAEYSEQPDVRFKHEIVYILETGSGPIVWSTSTAFNSVMSGSVRVPVVSSTELDENYDGKKDSLKLTIETSLLQDEAVYSATLLLIFDLRLHHICQLIMEGVAFLQHTSGLPVSAVQAVSELQIRQLQPLPPSGSHRIYNASVLPHSSFSASDWRLVQILSDYGKRNITTSLANTYTTWQTGTSDTFTMDLQLRYVSQILSYQPGFWYMLKWAWIQYLSVLVVVIYTLHLTKEWVYTNQIVRTSVTFPEKKFH